MDRIKLLLLQLLLLLNNYNNNYYNDNNNGGLGKQGTLCATFWHNIQRRLWKSNATISVSISFPEKTTDLCLI